jgi:outer membrane protein OmpA-like peptidoglycan-associated protein
MSQGGPVVIDETVVERLAKYQRRLRLQGVLAAALLAEVTLFTAVKLGEKEAAQLLPLALGPSFLTAVIVTGLLLAIARGSIEWQADLLARSLDRNSGGTAPQGVAKLEPDWNLASAAAAVPGVSRRWPRLERLCYVLAILVLLVAAVILLGYVWLPPILSPRSKDEIARPEVVGLPVEVYFNVDSVSIPQSMDSEIRAIGHRVAPLRDVKLSVEGHADSDYTSDYNLELSRLRAEAVKAILVEGGLDPARITIVGYGETMPRGPERSPSGKAQNRRVDIHLFLNGRL